MIPALAEANWLAGGRALLERELTRIPVLVSARISRSMTSLDNYASLLKALAPRQCSRNAERLSELQNRFSVAADGALKRNAARVDALAGMVSVLSPDNTLRRGYSITRVDGKT